MVPSACGTRRPALQGVEACDVRAGHHARRRLPLERGQRAVRNSPRRTHWVQRSDGILRGRWATSSATAPILTKQQLRQSVRETLSESHHVLPQPPRWSCTTRTWQQACPSGPRRGVDLRFRGQAPDGRRGKRWSLAGAEAMLALRSLKKSHDMISGLLAVPCPSGVARLYGRQPTYRPAARLRRVA